MGYLFGKIVFSTYCCVSPTFRFILRCPSRECWKSSGKLEEIEKLNADKKHLKVDGAKNKLKLLYLKYPT